MDILQKAINSNYSFEFQCGDFIFFGKSIDDTRYSIARILDDENGDFEMQYLKEFDSLKEYVNLYFDYEYCVLVYEQYKQEIEV